MPATLIGLAPSMPHRKHQNHPPGKDHFHGVIENLPSVKAGNLAGNTLPTTGLKGLSRFEELLLAGPTYRAGFHAPTTFVRRSGSFRQKGRTEGASWNREGPRSAVFSLS